MTDTISEVSNVPPEPPGPAPLPLVAPVLPRRLWRWPARVSVAVALLANGVAISTWFRLVSDSELPPALSRPSFSDQEVADAKGNVCAAYEKVRRAVGVSMARDGGSDSTAQLAVAPSPRQALLAGGEYLMTTLSEKPATEPDLAGPLGSSPVCLKSTQSIISMVVLIPTSNRRCALAVRRP